MGREIKYLAWMDLETNASGRQDILEVAGFITECDRPWTERASFEYVTVPDHPTWREELTVPTVIEMHTNNGLLAELDAGRSTPLAVADAEIAELMASIGHPHEFLIAGSGVAHFDRRVVRDHMPLTNKMLQYPALDVGVLRRALRFAGREDLSDRPRSGDDTPRADIPHRAMADIRDHFAEWLTYAHLLGSIDSLA